MPTCVSPGARRTLTWCLLAFAGLTLQADAADDTCIAYFGTYTDGTSQGIYAARWNPASGRLGQVQLAATTRNPSFLALHPTKPYLYAVGEISDFQGSATGEVVAFRIRPDHTLQELNRQSSGGAGPCHLVIDRLGQTVLVANYGGGSICALRIEPDGSLGGQSSFHQHHGSSVDQRRQQAPHAHSVRLDPANAYAFCADLGLDKILAYRFDAKTGRLRVNDSYPATSLPAGSGPRHFTFHPAGHFAYVINELTSTVTGFRYNAAQGQLNVIETVSTLPKEFQGTSHTAEVVVHPSGRFLYGSNRGHDSVAAYEVDENTGRLSMTQIQSTLGKTPRNFNIDPSGRYLLAANQGSDNVVVFRLDTDSGRLAPTGQIVEVPTPVCIVFDGR